MLRPQYNPYEPHILLAFQLTNPSFISQFQITSSFT
jgi:hypothetical protein